ncbi:YebC/PmpR family DNA-binding transcriptional regulator [Coxiella endosymbiont of Ornithodoros amblus]|uniref:YebC/PmpR family DNA-binding transcriptional regulator n=1 Tax=Coxiella endosymbiont of Ornithodoros amblus TaxID=1656166 RepID=UPI00244E00A3|nr:YebC/PmpR family DNA-binding transcriptional regulator [Coxiella endosymbiont of Ornithodoros amblus]MBW5802800.1 YebC/PmpR family DNA-binding transcriptional regulator [Coxiella endosymbiont of Ornithodoros amblus]
MAGHSKWANIKHTKARQDAKRGKVFTRLIREITVATRLGGEDIDSNPRLRSAVDKAFAANMPKDTITRAIKRGAGSGAGDNLVEVRYEAYGPGGVAVMVDCLTDNKNRTVSDVRNAFSKCGGNLSTEGSVAYLFKQRGLITFLPNSDEEKIMEVALDTGAEDVTANDDGSIDVTTTPENFDAVHQVMKAADLSPAHAEITLLASMEVKLDKDNAERMLRLTEMLEDLDDVQNVYSNADLG